MSADPEEERRSILASTTHLQEDLELSASDREAAEAVAEGLRVNGAEIMGHWGGVIVYH